MKKQTIEVTVEEGDVIVGYIATFKVLAASGKYYWATRHMDVNDMEALGIATDMVNSFSDDLRNGKEFVDDLP